MGGDGYQGFRLDEKRVESSTLNWVGIPDPRKCVSPLNDAATQALVFAREQLLREIVAALVGVPARPGKVMIDP